MFGFIAVVGFTVLVGTGLGSEGTGLGKFNKPDMAGVEAELLFPVGCRGEWSPPG